ncbi:MAG TPA: hypothetical protein VKH40_08700 [Alloacidobacterium sp.]|nr:hypothetical protein [Alloacidobacterium sp.]
MNVKQPGPTLAYKKNNGMWTFDIFPNGSRREAGDYPDEAAAKEWSVKAWLHWKANGYTYGSVSTIVSRQTINTL